jgi:hypothetical protein
MSCASPESLPSTSLPVEAKMPVDHVMRSSNAVLLMRMPGLVPGANAANGEDRSPASRD